MEKINLYIAFIVRRFFIQMILLSQNAIANQPPPLILSHFLLIKLWVPKIQKQIQQNEFIQGNPLAIGFRAIVMLIFILYANKIRGESNW